MNNLLDLLTQLNGKKTYIIAIAGLIWGIYTGDYNTILLALGMAGLRHGISTELKKDLAPITPSVPAETVGVSSSVEVLPVDPPAQMEQSVAPETQVFG